MGPYSFFAEALIFFFSSQTYVIGGLLPLGGLRRSPNPPSGRAGPGLTTCKIIALLTPFGEYSLKNKK